MVTERARRQYLETMGINLWVARHPLPNALASSLPALEEAPDKATTEADHGQRLHALIGDVEHQYTTPPQASPISTREYPVRARSARALLEDNDIPAVRPDTPPAVKDTPVEVRATPEPALQKPPEQAADTPVEVVAPGASQEPLRFSLQVAALDGRWLLLMVRDQSLSSQEEALFEAIVQAGGVKPSAQLVFQRFGWPMMEGLPVDDALDEARQGFKAFLAGRRAWGWHPERVLMFGHLPVLEKVLDIQDAYSRVLDIPLWQGPSIESLESADARRDLWQRMGQWSRWWQSDDAGTESVQTHED